MNLLRSPALTGIFAAGLLVAGVAWLAPATADTEREGEVVTCRCPEALSGKRHTHDPTPVQQPPAVDCKKPAPQQAPKIDVVFVVDTTGSMGGLIEGAKQKVWSIANEILSGNPRPRVSIGLVAYRDRGDAYVTQITQLTEDLDAVYGKLQGFSAQGGGDGPEHVNKGLQDAFRSMQWSQDSQLKLVYLVGDAPAHRDYDRQWDYTKIVPEARARGIIVNTALCGSNGVARQQFQHISRLGGGEFFQIAQNGGMTAAATPYDRRMKELARELEETKVTFGSARERRQAAAKKARVMDMDGEAAAARASAVSKMAPGAPAQSKDLVDAFAAGEADGVADEALPEPIRKLSKQERKAKLGALAARRAKIKQELNQLARKRDAHVRAEAPKGGFDGKVLESLKEKASEAGISYGK